MPPTHKRPLLLLAAIALVAIALIVVLSLLLCGEPQTAPTVPDSGVAAQSAPLDGGVEAAIEPDAAAARPAPKPKATRAISTRELRELQRRNRGLIDLCYRRAARRAPELVRRKTEVAVQLVDGGRIASVEVHAGGDDALEACLGRAIRSWRFSRTLKGQRVTFPIVFAR